eukprot:5006864-Pyramimonas_sp.AAC.1
MRRKTRTIWGAIPAHRPLIPPVCESTMSSLMQSVIAARRKAWWCLITSEFNMIERYISAVILPLLPLWRPHARPALWIAASCTKRPVFAVIAWMCGKTASGAALKTAFWTKSWPGAR